jgi:F-type H+-transporting ATPase subunit b
VANVQAEIDQLLAQIRGEAESDKARIIAAAEEQARRLKEDAARQIEAEIAGARLLLRREVVQAAAQAAESLLKSAVGPDDQQKMSERYVSELEARARAGRA